jgi:hypothetical protein
MKNEKPITIKELDSLIAAIEGKKKQVSIGNVREIRKIIDILIKLDNRVFLRYKKLVENR